MIFLVSLLAISAVGAADNSTEIIAGSDNSANQVGIVNEESNFGSSIDDEDLLNDSQEDDFESHPSESVNSEKLGTGNNEILGVIYVQGNTFKDINDAIKVAQKGERIILEPITYVGNEYSDYVVIDKSITLVGQNGTVFDGQGKSRMIYVRADNVIMDCIKFIHGKSDNGGAIYLQGKNCWIINCTFYNTHATRGDAIYLDNYSGFMIDDSHIKINPVLMAVDDGLSLTLTFLANFDYRNVFYIGVMSMYSIEGDSYWNGSAYVSGLRPNLGIIQYPNQNVTLEIYNSSGELVDNVSALTDGNGQIIYDYYELAAGDYTYNAYALDDESEVMSATGSFTVDEIGDFNLLQTYINKAGENGIVNLTRNYTFTNGLDDNITGGISIPFNLTVYGNGYTIDAKNSARIFLISDGEVTIENIRFINGNGDDNLKRGGAIYVTSPSPCEISNCSFVNNSANVAGGAIGLTSGMLSVSNSRFIGNKADRGEAIFSEAELKLCQNTINKTSAQIYSSGTILSPTEVTVLGNNTVEARYGKNVTLNATYADDNGNLIRVPVLNFQVEGVDIVIPASCEDGVYKATYEVDVRGKKIVYVDLVDVTQYTGLLDIGKTVTDLTVVANDTIIVKQNETVSIMLVDELGNMLNETVEVYVTNGAGDRIYEKQVTTVNGTVVVEIPKLPLGDNNITVAYSGDENYTGKTVSSLVHVVPIATVLQAETFEMYQGDGTKYVVNLTDNDGNPIVGMGIKVNITGKTYTIITDENGTAVLPINLKVGIHPATAIFSGKGDYANATPVSTDVNVLTEVRIDQHKNLVKDYGDADKFTVHAVDKYGKSVGANAKVKMTVAGKTYTVFTDAQGYASLPINLKPGTYDITCEYAGYSVTHKITVKQVLSATNRQYKKAASYKFTATLKHTNGKAISGKTVTFTFNGKTYIQNTNSKGEATITIKEALSVGTYNIAIKYLGSTIKKTITIK